MLMSLTAGYMSAQDRVITTGVPFLQIAADARSAGMGDMGAASSADAFSQQHNPAKYAFAIEKQGVAVSYTPYMASIANDISLAQLNYYNRINERSAFAGSLRYFGLGDIELRNSYEDQARVVSPNELALDGTYALKLDERFAAAVTGRYIRSALKVPDGNTDASAANTFAFDISAFYQSEEIAYSEFNGRWRVGLNLQNLGPKINYNNDGNDESANFLPSNFKLGAGFDFILDEYNKVSVLAEINKLMVPSPKEIFPVDIDGDGEISNEEIRTANSQARSDYNRIGWSSGLFKSFGDASGGMKEELQEVAWALGAEYWYQDSFAFRAGYFNEHELKGARKYATIGAGFKYNVVKVDVSYLFSTSKVQNPLENTLRFSLTFNFGDSYDEY